MKDNLLNIVEFCQVFSCCSFIHMWEIHDDT